MGLVLGPHYRDFNIQESHCSAWALMEGEVSLGVAMDVSRELVRVPRGIA